MDFRRTANVQSEKMALIAGISTCRKQCSSSLKASRGLPAWPPPSRTCASWKGHEGLSQLWACLVFAFEKLLDTNAQRCCRCGCGCRLHHQVLQVRARPPGLVFVVTRRSHLLAWLAGRWRQYSSHTKYRPKSYFETLLWFRFGGLHFTLTSTILFGKITVLYNRWPTRPTVARHRVGLFSNACHCSSGDWRRIETRLPQSWWGVDDTFVAKEWLTIYLTISSPFAQREKCSFCLLRTRLVEPLQLSVWRLFF